MNYQRIYDQFIADRRLKEHEILATGCYVERHHIKQRHEGGSDSSDNLIFLTPSDHYFAHLLLAYAKGGKSWAALWAMTNTGDKRKRDRRYVIRQRRWFHKARTEAAKSHSGELHSRARSIICLNTRKEYATANVAAKALGSTGTNVKKSIKDRYAINNCFLEYKDKLSPPNKTGIKSALLEIQETLKARKIARKKANRIAAMTRTKHSLESCKEIANRYSDLSDFYTKEPNVYKKITACGWIDICCSHLKRESTAKQVKCLETGQIFASIHDAGIAHGLKSGNTIGRCAQGRSKKAAGYHWAYA